jgi:hypothetical protein
MQIVQGKNDMNFKRTFRQLPASVRAMRRSAIPGGSPGVAVELYDAAFFPGWSRQL